MANCLCVASTSRPNDSVVTVRDSRMHLHRMCLVLLFCCLMRSAASGGEAVTVEISGTDGGYRLLRDGKPFFVKGAVYWAPPENEAYPLSTVVAHGGNSIRIGGKHLDALVAAAEQLGLTVTIGLPLKKQREGFDYDDDAAVRKQFEEAKAIVLRHKDSPATLIWGVGNELSHGNVADNTFTNLNVWDAVNDIAKMIHEVDPHHPAMTVIGTASLRRGDIREIIRRCPYLDLIGINSYRDIAEVPGWLERDGWTKPYLITEWGNDGSWQVTKTKWGAPIEATTSEVAELMIQRYRDVILRDQARCLGSYAFFWEQAPWRTPTWYSFYLDSGDRLAAANALQHLWTGQWPANRAPKISPMTINGKLSSESVEVSPDSTHEAVVTVNDAEGDALSYSWEIVSDATKGGDVYAGLAKTPLLDDTGSEITFSAPAKPGPYRLFVYVRDGKGNVASANLPFLVTDVPRDALKAMPDGDQSSGQGQPGQSSGGDAPATAVPVMPTAANVAYGTHDRQVLDFYQATSDKPTPVVFFIHGGGWGANSKENVHKLIDVPRLLKQGISVAAINYRYVHHAHAAGVKPPVKWPLEDAARALQFVRTKADAWNIDKQRIGACGGSAGACSSLWLALHDDMAQPSSTDPVSRESTRLYCAAVIGAQTSLDPQQMREWMPNAVYGGHAFGFRDTFPKTAADKAAEFQRFLEARETMLPFIREYSPIEHASADDPPLWLSFSDQRALARGDRPDDPTHSVLFGRMLEERLKPLGVDITITCPAAPQGDDRNATDAMIRMLKSALPKKTDDFPVVMNSPAEAELAPMSAVEAATAMKLPDGFHATDFAAEPDVQNPIAMAWDERGRRWIAENYTYSDRTQRFDLSLRDRVLIFEDLDNDGKADSRKVFTDNVQMLTSVEVGRGGVWLMCPPRLLFIPDSDADDIPDGPPQVMLDGFDVAQDNYHNFGNGLRWGPDGWLYGRCGHSCPGRIGVPGTPDDQRIPLDGGIWRFHPDKKIVEVLCHGTTNPWGHDWDENGELFFINTVIGHLWHAVPGSHFKEPFGESMNPGVYERMDMIADHYHFDTQGSRMDSRDGKANDLGGGHAHVGMLIYQGSQWPERYHGKLLTINMHGQRANVERLERSGTGYVGRHEPDFFVAADPFFRGIDLSTGPDGNVLLIDWSDAGECHEHTGVHRLSGRIFKITYGESATPGPIVKPSCLQGNGPLQRLWRDYQAGRLTPEQLRELEHDPDEHMRVWAIRLLTDFWPLDWVTGPNPSADYPEDDDTREMLVRMARNDPSGLVHRILASTLQRMPVAERQALALELVRHKQHAEDRELALLVWYGLIPVGEQQPKALLSIAKQSRWPPLTQSIARNLASRLKSEPDLLNLLLLTASELDESLQQSILRGVHDALRGWRKAPRPAAWDEFSQLSGISPLAETVRQLSTLFGDGRALQEIRQIALDESAEMKVRQNALQTLVDARPADLREVCESLIDVRVLNATAARGLALFDDADVARLLARKYKRFHPDDRSAVIEKLVSRPAYAVVLLEELASGNGAIRATDITAAQARQIHNLGDESLKRRLAEVWGELRDSSAERLAQIDQLKGQLTRETLASADLSAGRQLFNKTCAACHQLYGEGQKVGPDLTGAQRTNLDYLLGNIVDPSAVVGKEYRMSILALVDGRVLNGLVVTRNDQTLVLQTATERVSLPTEDIDEIAVSSQSAMPDGLLQTLTTEQIRDLIAYLQSPVQVPLGEARIGATE